MLTREQDLAARLLWTDNRYRALQIVAGAGSGKTTTLVHSVQKAVENGIPADRIALITFTRKAAFEMKDRLAKHNLKPAFTGTMHSLAWHLLKAAGKQPGKLATGHEHAREQIIREMYPRFSHIPLPALLHAGILSASETEAAEEKYRLYKKTHGIFDYDDLISEASLLNEFSGFFSTLLVDEFQDTSPDQLEFITTLQPGKLLVVGDDWQSIYKFRKSEVSISREFVQNRPNAVRLFLTDNFRSQKNIVTLGNRVIRLSSDFIKKKLKANFSATAKSILYIGSAAKSPENLWISYLKKNKHKSLTILVRTNYLKNILEKHLPENMQVMTIHAAKGLEFDNVLVFGVSQHVFPHRWADFDEEVRLLYVAVTRAKHSLQFLAWETPYAYSSFLPFLHNECDIVYL